MKTMPIQGFNEKMNFTTQNLLAVYLISLFYNLGISCKLHFGKHA